MADLYGTAPASALPDPEEISTFINQFLHSSSSSSASCMPFKAKYVHSFSSPPLPEANSGSILMRDRRRLAGSVSQVESECRIREGNSGADADSSSSGVNFSDRRCYFGTNVKERTENTFSSAGDLSCDSEKGPEASEVPSNPIPPKTSSKRSRAAEVHNLSEKRRRSRINEKMKALQNLIPNSNKTDKASMLDEAIEYLKQLQLQVQMLSMRNGLGLYPMCLPGVPQPFQLPSSGMGYNEGSGLLNSNPGTGTYSATEGNLVQTDFNLSAQCASSNQPIAIPSATNIATFEVPFGFQPSIQANYGSFDLTTSSEEICQDSKPQLQLDVNQSGDNSSDMS